MTGSVLDGEDVVQEALFRAHQSLASFDTGRSLKPWLFRIAHNGCVDWRRRRGVQREAEAAVLEPEEEAEFEEGLALPLDRAVEHLVVLLPPKERACVLLKDVLDHSLEDIAELLDSSVGSVKAALNRGRAKLASVTEESVGAPPTTASRSLILELYVERFNRRDWEGLRELIRDDAQLRVADRYVGRLAEAPYFSTYAGFPQAWRLTVAELEGAPVAIVHLWEDGWKATGVVHFEVLDERIAHIDDYLLCPWVLEHAAFFGASPPQPPE
jgi:RNA polymerase sigma-70 factor (ECF subfamily)